MGLKIILEKYIAVTRIRNMSSTCFFKKKIRKIRNKLKNRVLWKI